MLYIKHNISLIFIPKTFFAGGINISASSVQNNYGGKNHFAKWKFKSITLLNVQLEYRGNSHVPTKVMMCRMSRNNSIVYTETHFTNLDDAVPQSIFLILGNTFIRLEFFTLGFKTVWPAFVVMGW